MDWKLLKKILGAVLIVIGLFAFLTPLTPGGWLLFVGAELLGIEMLSQRRLRETYFKMRSWLNSKKTDQSQDSTDLS
jgi:hypothetical protein